MHCLFQLITKEVVAASLPEPVRKDDNFNDVQNLTDSLSTAIEVQDGECQDILLSFKGVILLYFYFPFYLMFTFFVGQYYAVFYEERMYLGQVVDVRCTCSALPEVHVQFSFLEQRQSCCKDVPYGKPTRPDIDCVEPYRVISGPVHVVQSRRFLTVPEAVHEAIMAVYQAAAPRMMHQ